MTDRPWKRQFTAWLWKGLAGMPLALRFSEGLGFTALDRLSLFMKIDGTSTTATRLWTYSLEQLQRLLLGETEIVLFHQSPSGALEGQTFLVLTQTRFHRLARLLIRRANSYRQRPQLQILCAGQSLRALQDSDRRGSTDREPKVSPVKPNVRANLETTG